DNYTVQSDRSSAIKQAVSMAETGDTLLVAGKGHEDYQEINGIRYPFSDKEVIKKAIKDEKSRN
ncbi:MAG: UDP-N-acetylmuramoyl-L-alanyl-D-glutamate--2,6-diaminopimelate ligase, partial [Nitrospirota bacterium]